MLSNAVAVDTVFWWRGNSQVTRGVSLGIQQVSLHPFRDVLMKTVLVQVDARPGCRNSCVPD